MAAPSPEAIAAAGRCLADAYARMESLSPEEAAAAAYVPGGPSLAELTERIRSRREPAAAEVGAA